MLKHDCRFATDRLQVCEWHSVSQADWDQEALESIVINTLTPQVTQSLPPSWQGSYSSERASSWIKERDSEGMTLLVIEKNNKSAIGLVILSASADGRDLRLGYLLNESVWGKGFASELISGLIEWCRENKISSVTGGVEQNNRASKKVLEKAGFKCLPATDDQEEKIYRIELIHTH